MPNVIGKYSATVGCAQVTLRLRWRHAHAAIGHYLFMSGFLLDAILSVADIWLPISSIRYFFTWVVFGCAMLLGAATVFTPRLPNASSGRRSRSSSGAGSAGDFPSRSSGPTPRCPRSRSYSSSSRLECSPAICCCDPHRREPSSRGKISRSPPASSSSPFRSCSSAPAQHRRVAIESSTGG